MRTETYYVENCKELDAMLEAIVEAIPCFLDRKFIEMDYSELEIQARQEDFPIIEKYIAYFV